MNDANTTASHDTNADDIDVWSLVDFVVAVDEVDLISDALWTRGVVAIEERQGSDEIVTLRTSMGDDPSKLMTEMARLFPHLTSTIVHIPRTIADTWRQFATPTFVDESLAIVPAWLSAPESVDALFIEPLDTFGLGNHPTTVLALRLAIRHVASRSQVFDLGSGSGVLAVGLAKFRQCNVAAYDIAQSAHEALLMNARLNEVDTVKWSDGLVGTDYDCVVANILAPVLIAESTKISNALSHNGLIILSGMRDEQVDGVVSHYPHMAIIDRESLDGWTATVLQRSH